MRGMPISAEGGSREPWTGPRLKRQDGNKKDVGLPYVKSRALQFEGNGSQPGFACFAALAEGPHVPYGVRVELLWAKRTETETEKYRDCHLARCHLGDVGRRTAAVLDRTHPCGGGWLDVVGI